MRTAIITCLISLGLVLMGSGAVFAAPESFTIGKAKVTPLQDLPGAVPITVLRGETPEAMKAVVPSGSAPAGMTVFLVQVGGQDIIVDTGYGSIIADRKTTLPDLLGQVGLKAEDIDVVFLTHLHRDHVGGIVTTEGAAVFPKATVQVSDKELAFWTDPKILEKYPDLESAVVRVKNMRKSYGNKVKTFTFDASATPVPGFSTIAAPGHTPGHSLFLLNSDGKQLLFWGDTIHAAALQFANPAITAIFDVSMPDAAKTRLEVFAMAAKGTIPVAGAHLPYPAIGRVTKKDGNGEYAFTPGL